jgi:hypothetical protein
MGMRISRPRKEYGHEGFSFIEKDAGENHLNVPIMKNLAPPYKKKVLEIGL